MCSILRAILKILAQRYKLLLRVFIDAVAYGRIIRAAARALWTSEKSRDCKLSDIFKYNLIEDNIVINIEAPQLTTLIKPWSR